MTKRKVLLAGISGLGLAGWLAARNRLHAEDAGGFPVTHSDDEWRRMLTPVQYQNLAPSRHRAAGVESA